MKKKPVSTRARFALIDPVYGVLLLFFPTLPFVVSFSGFDKFRLPKEIFVTVAVSVVLALFLALRTVALPRRFHAWTWIWLATVAFVAVHASWIGAPGDGRLRGVVLVLLYSALMWVLSESLSEDRQRSLWLLISLSFSVNAVVTILQYFGSFPLMELASGGSLGGRATPAGLIGDVNSGAFLFGLACVISLHGMTLEKHRTKRPLWFVAFCLNLSGLAFTRTLTAAAALAVSLLIWLGFHHWWAIRKAAWSWRRLAYLWAALLIGGAAGSAIAYKAGVFNRVALVSRQMARGDWGVATAGRQPVYSITWKMIQESPWLGRGLNSFGREFFSYRVNTKFGRNQKLINQPGAFRQAHNEYLQVWDELGIVGLTLFALLYFGLLWQGARLALRSPDPVRSHWAGTLTLAGFFTAVSSLTFFPFHLAVTVSYVVLVVACLRRTTRPETSRDGIWEPGERMPPPLRRRWVKPMAIAILVAIVMVSQIRLWQANREIGLAAFLLDQAATPGLDQRRTRIFADEALTRLQRVEEHANRFQEIYNLEGSALMLLGRHDKAVQSYGKATVGLPSPETYTNLAAAYMAAGEPEKARPLLETALDYNPSYQRARDALSYLDKTDAR